jgi:hypothetical protein
MSNKLRGCSVVLGLLDVLLGATMCQLCLMLCPKCMMCIVCLVCLMVCHLPGVPGVPGEPGVPGVRDGVQAVLDGQFGAPGGVLDDMRGTYALWCLVCLLCLESCPMVCLGVPHGVPAVSGCVHKQALCTAKCIIVSALSAGCPECSTVSSGNVFVMHMHLPCFVSLSVAIFARDMAAALWSIVPAPSQAQVTLDVLSVVGKQDDCT